MLRLTLLAAFSGLAAFATAQPVPETKPGLKALPAEGDPNAPSKAAPATAALDGPLPAAEGKPTGDDAVRLQIFLDQNHFGPGIVDGKAGRFTELAVLAWNEVNGHASDDWHAVMEAARKAVPNPFATAVVPDSVKDWVDPTLPTSRSEQAKKKRMSYRSIAEFMSERYHCDVPYLIALNPA